MCAKCILRKNWTNYFFHPERIRRNSLVHNQLKHFAEYQSHEIYEWMKKVIRYESYKDTTHVWLYYVSLLHQVTGQMERYKYVDHLFYIFSNLIADNKHPSYDFRPDVKSNVFCWGNTRLDQYSKKIAKNLLYKYKLIPSVSHYKGHSVYIIWDYLIEIYLSDFIAKNINMIYQNVKSEKDIDIDYITSLLKTKSEWTIIIRHDRDDAQAWIKRLLEHK